VHIAQTAHLFLGLQGLGVPALGGARQQGLQGFDGVAQALGQQAGAVQAGGVAGLALGLLPALVQALGALARPAPGGPGCGGRGLAACWKVCAVRSQSAARVGEPST